MTGSLFVLFSYWSSVFLRSSLSLWLSPLSPGTPPSPPRLTGDRSHSGLLGLVESVSQNKLLELEEQSELLLESPMVAVV